MRTLLIFLLLALASATGAGAEWKTRSFPVAEADRVVVRWMPEYILTRADVKPEQLEQWYERQAVIRRADAKAWARFERALACTQWQPAREEGDYRFVIHLRRGGKVLARIYLAPGLGRAVVDGGRHRYRGALTAWARSL